MSSVIPEKFTLAQTDAAIEALGLPPRGIGLVSVNIGVHAVTVERYIREEQPDGTRRTIGLSLVTVPIDRRPVETSTFDTSHYTTDGYHPTSHCDVEYCGEPQPCLPDPTRDGER